MKTTLSALIFTSALTLSLGCGREPNQPPSTELSPNVQEAKRRNEDLRELKKMREDSAKEAVLTDTFNKVQKLSNARIDRLNAERKVQRAKFNGKWVAIANTADGVEVPAAKLKEEPWYWVVDESKNVWKQPGSGPVNPEDEIHFKIDHTTNPKTFDLIDPKNKTNKGIYEFDGDTLKICYAAGPDGERPSDFTSKPDSKRVLVIWKRVEEVQ